MHAYKLDTHLQWRSVTVICNMHNWKALIDEAIIPFFKKAAGNRSLHAYYLQFYYSVGNYARLAFLMHTADADALSLQLHMSLQTFLSKHNNIQDATPFINYETYYKEGIVNVPARPGFEQQSTDIILNALANGEVSEEIIFTLAYQLHVTLIKALMASTKKDLAFFANIYKHLYLNQSLVTVSEEFIISLFKENENHYCETTTEIFDQDLTDKNDAIPTYIRQWYAACIEEINNLNTIAGRQEVRTIHRYISFQLNQQCGLTHNFKSLLYYSVWQVLSHSRQTV